jgi:phage terminase small subunit
MNYSAAGGSAAKLTIPERVNGDLGKVWAEMAPQVAVSIGAAGLEALCVQVVRMRDAAARINAEGMIVADVKGAPVPHPAISIERGAQSQVRDWLVKFSL